MIPEALNQESNRQLSSQPPELPRVAAYVGTVGSPTAVQQRKVPQARITHHKMELVWFSCPNNKPILNGRLCQEELEDLRSFMKEEQDEARNASEANPISRAVLSQ